MVRDCLTSENDTPRSLWQLKPWWCQPWTILGTGLLAILASWQVLHLWWISLPVFLAVLLWWWLFLVVVPRAYRAELEQEPILKKE
jgi:hypothetical protein